MWSLGDRKKPILGVVGDSYFSASAPDSAAGEAENPSGKHYTEILANMLGYDYFTLARGACSNTAIRLQVDEMIKQGVDFVIYGTTTEGRIEYPITDHYNPGMGVYNIEYNHCADLSSLNPLFGVNNIRSETLSNIVCNPPHPSATRDQAQLDALNSYFEHIYIEGVKAQQDSWIIASGLQALRRAGIPFMLVMYQCNLRYDSYFNQQSSRFVFGCDENQVDLTPQHYTTNTLRRWHTSDESQQILAQKTHKYILEHGLLEANFGSLI
jgi:hypothetical protein